MSGKEQEYDDEKLGFGRGEDDEDDEEADESMGDDDVDVELADLDVKLSRTGLWEAPESVQYDGRQAGPRRMPEGYMNFSPLQIFLLLFPLKLFQSIVVQTNLYYLQGLPADEVMVPLMTLHELFVFVALHMMMTSCWGGSQDDFFLGKGGFDARRYMTRDRFYWIKKHLHFADKSKKPAEGTPGYDPLYLIRPLVDTLNRTFRMYWKLSDYVSLDEMMVAFKGHNPFHCFIPRKPHPNGTKMHAICCAKSYFCVAFLVSDGIKRSIPGIAAALFAGNVIPGMTVITDRYYTCTALVRLCLALGVGFIGSTMANRFLAKHVLRGWSAADAKRKARGTFEVAATSCGRVANIIWKDKGIVRLTVTAGSSMRYRVVRRARGIGSFFVTAPFCAHVFDSYFHGVDRNDQLRGSGYGLALFFRAKKYTVKLFLGLLDLALSNAFIMWRVLHPKDRKFHRRFWNQLARELLEFNPANDPVYRPPEPARARVPHTLVLFARRKGKGGSRFQRRRGDCPVCSTPLVRNRATGGCMDCNVALHCGECAQKWHQWSLERRLKAKTRFRKLIWDLDTATFVQK
jgi:hypothetical protein